MSDARNVHKAWPSLAIFAGLILVYFGERVFSSPESSRWMLTGLGLVLIVGAAVMRVLQLNAASADRKPVVSLFVFASFGVMLAIVLYFATTFSEPPAEGPDRLRAIIHVAWLLVLTISLAALSSLEIAVLPVQGIDRYEVRKTKLFFHRGVGLGLVLGCVFLLNYVTIRDQKKVDLSFGQKTLATDSTRKLIGELSKPVRVVLFYPAGNEVAAALQSYFDSVASISPNLTIERTDQALAGKIATETKVSENGFVTVSHDKTHEKIKVPVKWKSARTKLKKFDSEFAKALIKVTRQSKVAYFTTGHRERSASPGSDDRRPPLRKLKTLLKNNQYEIKNLGLGEGLASELPKDHSIIFIMGPEKPFLPEEVQAIKAGLSRGARLMIALEAEREGDPMTEVLAELGLEFDKTLLANERAYVKKTRTPADVNYIVSNKYSSHESVTTLTRNADKLFTAFALTGSLKKADKTPPGVTVDMVINTMTGTFNDVDGDHVFDRATEKKATYGLAAVVTKTATTGSDRNTRVFVVSDVDIFADDLVRNEGNGYLMADIAYWLSDVKEAVVPRVSEEDVKIEHRRDEDITWFYSTTVAVPLGVFALGFFFVGRRRKK